MFAKSLEDHRRERYLEITEFVAFLGISPRTYYRMLDRDPAIRPKTMRKVAAKLNVPPPAIVEFLPPPSPELLAQLTERLDHALTHGVYLVDPETGEPTDERIFITVEEPHVA